MATEWHVGDVIQNRWEVRGVRSSSIQVICDVYDRQQCECLVAWTLQDEVFARHPQVAGRFAQAAGAWTCLAEHPSVVPARFAETVGGKLFVFAQYVGSDNLGNWIGTPRLGKDTAQALRFAIQCCDGLAHVGTAGLVHGDIKPANCVITEDRTLMITSVGLANALIDEAAGARAEPAQAQPARRGLFRTSLFGPRRAPPVAQSDTISDIPISDTQALVLRQTASSVRAGTPAYLAPEQFDEAQRVGPLADIYAFGVMLYEMLTGALPFVGRTWREFENLHKTQQVSAARAAVEANLLTALNGALERCLAKKPDDRFANFGAVRAALAGVFQKLTGQPAPEPLTGARRAAAALIVKGQGLDRMGRHEEAIGCYDLATKEDANAWTALSGKAIALAALRRSEEAAAAGDRAFPLSPRHDLAWTHRGILMNACDKPEEALECFDRALELNPLNDRAWLRKTELLWALGRTYEALDAVTHAVELNPRDAETLLEQATLLHTMGRPVDEIECYDRVLAVTPHKEEAWLGKSEALSVLGRTSDEFECIEQSLKQLPKSRDLWSRKGALLVAMGRPVDELPKPDPMTAPEGGAEKSFLAEARGLAAKGLHAEALDRCSQALAADPQDPAAWYMKGTILFNCLANHRDALPCFEEASRLGLAQAAMGVTMCQRTASR